jgi:GT2 family glycosyltransferase
VERVTIVIPTYNSGRTVGETLASLAEQGPHLGRVASVWIADDCSSDDTLAAVGSAWSAALPLEILTGEHNLGERRNLNRAVGRLRPHAEWVLILHSDDVAKPNWLGLILERISDCGASVASICSSWDNWKQDGSVTPGEDDSLRPIEIIQGNRASVRDTLRRGCWWHISGCAIRLKAFDDVGEFDARMPQLGDWEWLLRCLARGWSVEYIPRTLIRYRQHEASVSALSFRMDRDIRESLEIIGRHVAVLSRWDVLALHGQRMRSCSRRLARAVFQLDVRRATFVLQTSWVVLVSLVRIVACGRRCARNSSSEAGA